MISALFDATVKRQAVVNRTEKTGERPNRVFSSFADNGNRQLHKPHNLVNMGLKM